MLIPTIRSYKGDLGAIYLQNRRLTEALRHLQRAVALQPSDGDAYFTLAEVHVKLDDFPEAAKSYLTAIDMNGDFAEAYYNLGRIYAQLGKRDMARESLQKVIGLFQRQGKSLEAEVSKEVYHSQFGPGK